jgi:hypothetical protein
MRLAAILPQYFGLADLTPPHYAGVASIQYCARIDTVQVRTPSTCAIQSDSCDKIRCNDARDITRSILAPDYELIRKPAFTVGDFVSP